MQPFLQAGYQKRGSELVLGSREDPQTRRRWIEEEIFPTKRSWDDEEEIANVAGLARGDYGVVLREEGSRIFYTVSVGGEPISSGVFKMTEAEEMVGASSVTSLNLSSHTRGLFERSGKHS